MRISFFVPKCTHENSHGRYAIELAKCLATWHEVDVYAGAVWPPLRTMLRCHFLPVLNRPTLARLATLWAASALVMARRRFEIVHAQGADVPVGGVVTAHCCNAAMEAASNLGGGLRRRLNFALGAFVERYCLTKPSTDRVIAVSHKVKAEIEQRYRVDPQKVVVIYLGVDLERFHPRNRVRWRQVMRQRLGLAPEDFVILYVGGNYRLKGLIPLLQVVHGLQRKLKVVAVGVIPDQFLARLLASEDHQGQVVVGGPTDEISPYYGAADCFVLPTLYDTFSLVTLEAMACGLPVIVSRAAGISELLRDGVDSLLLHSPRDIEELTGKLCSLIKDEALRITLGSNARKTAEQYSWDRVVERTLLVYRQALEAKRV